MFLFFLWRDVFTEWGNAAAVKGTGVQFIRVSGGGGEQPAYFLCKVCRFVRLSVATNGTSTATTASEFHLKTFCFFFFSFLEEEIPSNNRFSEVLVNNKVDDNARSTSKGS